MMRMTFLALAFGAMLLPAACAGDKLTLTAAEKLVLDLTNQERKKHDLPPLTLNPTLFKVARAHSENMGRQMKMEHTLDEKTAFDRLRAAGYKYAAAGENIGSGDPRAPVTLVMQAWMESEGHRANILNKEYTEIGVGVGRDKEGNLYYTQVFGRPLR